MLLQKQRHARWGAYYWVPVHGEGTAEYNEVDGVLVKVHDFFLAFRSIRGYLYERLLASLLVMCLGMQLTAVSVGNLV